MHTPGSRCRRHDCKSAALRLGDVLNPVRARRWSTCRMDIWCRIHSKCAGTGLSWHSPPPSQTRRRVKWAALVNLLWQSCRVAVLIVCLRRWQAPVLGAVWKMWPCAGQLREKVCAE